MAPNLDVIGAIEVAYDTTLSESDWVDRIARTVSPAFGAGVAPTTVYLFDFGAPKPVPIGTFASVGPGAFTREHFVNMQVVATPAELRKSYECEMFTLLSRVVGRPRTTEAIKSSDMHATGAMDPLGLRANITHDSGVIITTLVPLGFRIQQRTLWTRLASHIGAGARLRSAQRSPTTAAAILTPSGKLEHATNATRRTGRARRVRQTHGSRTGQAPANRPRRSELALARDGERRVVARRLVRSRRQALPPRPRERRLAEAHAPALAARAPSRGLRRDGALEQAHRVRPRALHRHGRRDDLARGLQARGRVASGAHSRVPGARPATPNHG